MCIRDRSTAGRYVYPYFTCGVCGLSTKSEYLVIAEFTHFYEFWQFTSDENNFKKKEKISKITVQIAISTAE